MSEKGYGAFIYVRSVLETGNLRVRLLTFKSRMAPLNESSLTSIESFGVFVSYTFNQRRKNCPQKKIKIEKETYLADSKISLVGFFRLFLKIDMKK